MFKYLIFVVCLIFLYSCEQQPLINDYKVEGISTGNSLKDFLRDEKIEEFKLQSKNAYKDKPNQDFFYVNYFENLETYDFLSMFSRTNDKDYIINGLFATQYMSNKNSCFEKKEKTALEFSNTYKNTKRSFGEKINQDLTGKFTYDYFDFPSGSRIGIQCNMYNDGDVTFDISIVSSVDLIKWLEFGNEEISN